MPVLQSGGSLVTTGSIVDGTILNDDIAAAAAIAQSKIAGFALGNADIVSIEMSTNVTTSLTTVAGQVVFVICKASMTTGAATHTINATLAYNSVTQDFVQGQDSDNNPSRGFPFTLMALLEPGAATANITVTSSGTIANFVMAIIKMKKA